MKSRLSTYMAAVTVFAGLAIPVQASIRYTTVNTVIPNNGAYGIDFNHDGTKDFWIGSFFGPFYCGNRGAEAGSATVSPVQSTSGVILTGVFAAALPAGVSVGPGRSFAIGKRQLMFYNTCGGRLNVAGNWFDVTNHYLGMEFHVSGQTHYGWVKLTVVGGFRGLTTTVIGFAYETTPGKALITGQTSGAASSDLSEVEGLGLSADETLREQSGSELLRDLPAGDNAFYGTLIRLCRIGSNNKLTGYCLEGARGGDLSRRLQPYSLSAGGTAKKASSFATMWFFRQIPSRCPETLLVEQGVYFPLPTAFVRDLGAPTQKTPAAATWEPTNDRAIDWHTWR